MNFRVGDHFPKVALPKQVRTVIKTANHHDVFARGQDAQLVEIRDDGSQFLAWYRRMPLQELTQPFQKDHYLQVTFYGSTPADFIQTLNEVCGVNIFTVKDFLKIQVTKLNPGQAKVVTLTARADSTTLRGSIQVVISRPPLK
jgi:hypothetical protein